MYRHQLAQSLHASSRARARRGFTLVELLVVITIIAMLVGLLVPAVFMARGAARRTQCINNQRNIGLGIILYQTMKMKFPPLFSEQPNSSPLTAVGWVPPILPYIEQNPLYLTFQNNGWVSAQSAHVEVLLCPAANPPSSAAPLSYVVNGGTPDFFKTSGPTPRPKMDLQANGLFFDTFAFKFDGGTNANLRAPVTDIAYVSNHDGTKMTLMLSENLDAVDWIRVGATPGLYAPPANPTYQDGSAVQSWWQSMLWQVEVPAPNPDWGMTGFPTGQRLNKNVGTGPPFNFTMVTLQYNNTNNARPSSNHSGGFIVTTADGGSRFISEEIQYRVYCLLMSPDSASAKDPAFDNPPGTFVYPTNWYNNPGPMQQLKPVLENEIF